MSGEKVKDVITPKEFKERMKLIIAKNGSDFEGSHADMDDLMGEVLCQLGYEDGIHIFDQSERWYA